MEALLAPADCDLRTASEPMVCSSSRREFPTPTKSSVMGLSRLLTSLIALPRVGFSLGEAGWRGVGRRLTVDGTKEDRAGRSRRGVRLTRRNGERIVRKVGPGAREMFKMG